MLPYTPCSLHLGAAAPLKEGCMQMGMNLACVLKDLGTITKASFTTSQEALKGFTAQAACFTDKSPSY